ncbi:MAG: lysostaphin resistance A-like protein [Pyrinomonadaceae bacterium]
MSEIAIAPPADLHPSDAPKSFEPARNPPWTLLTAIATWIASVGLLLLPQVIAIPYVALHYRGTRPTTEMLLADKTLILILVSGVLPVHLITLVIVWAVATRFGKFSAVETLGLTWNGRLRLWRSMALAFTLYGAAFLLTLAFGGQGTALDRLVESSRAAALIIAFLAVATAPLVEESIYRGILYPAIERTAGAKTAVILVTLLFAVPHVPQYWPNMGVISSITLLSVVLTVVRARTGRLLPCFVVHLVFNGIQSVLIVLEPYLRAAFETVRHGSAGGALTSFPFLH